MNFPRHRQTLKANPSVAWLRFYRVYDKPEAPGTRSLSARRDWLRQHLPALHERCGGRMSALVRGLQSVGFYSAKTRDFLMVYTAADELRLQLN